MRKTQFINGEYYHIYNRGVDKRQIFLDEEDYLRFLRSLKDFNNKSYYEERSKIIKTYGFKELSSFLAKVEKVVEIICYCLVPNHFHLILKQLVGEGIPKILHKIGTSFTNFVNKKSGRSGSLFEGPYKAIHIDNNDYLLWLSGYVNGNIEIHGVAKAENYRWSSCSSFSGPTNNEIISNREIILSRFNELEKYKEYENFVKIVIKESKERKDLEKYLLEEI